MASEEELCEEFGLTPTYTLDPSDGNTKIITVEWAAVMPFIAQLSAVNALCRTMDRGVGYRKPGDHSTWDSYTEGKADFAGEVLELLERPS
jgi:hypothetical protein